MIFSHISEGSSSAGGTSSGGSSRGSNTRYGAAATLPLSSSTNHHLVSQTRAPASYLSNEALEKFNGKIPFSIEEATATTVADATAHAADATSHAADATSHIADATAHIADATAHAADATADISDTAAATATAADSNENDLTHLLNVTNILRGSGE